MSAMNIVFASDDNYMGFLATSMLSLLEHKAPDDEIKFFVFDDGIKEESKVRLAGMLRPYGLDVEYMRVPTTEELCGVTFSSQRWSSAMILRLFVASLLPEEVKRIIFLDCDVLVLQSLRPLWELDLGDYYIGGVLECSGDKRKRNLGLPPSAVYINAGVELIDLDNIRHSDAEDRYQAFLKKYNGYIPEVEQGTVNACISEHIMPIHPKWNAHTTFFMFDYNTQRAIKRPSVYPTEQEVREAVEHPAIVHFSGCCFSDIRPWLGNSDHPYAQAFMDVKARTPWGEPLYSPDKRTKKHRLCRWMYTHLPRDIYTAIMGFGYQYVLPWREAKKIQEAQKGRQNEEGKKLQPVGD